MNPELTRRQLLAGVTVGLGAVAGCGYRPGPGDIRWERTVGSGMYSPDFLERSGRTLFSVTRSTRSYDFDANRWTRGGRITAYDATEGVERWNEAYAPLSRPTVADGALFAGTESDELLAVERDGTERWRESVDSAPATVAATGDHVYAIAEDASISSHRTEDGSERWRRSIEFGGGVDDDEVDDVEMTASVDAVALVRPVGRYGTSIAAFDSDGSRRWTVDRTGPDAGSSGRPVASGTSLYLPMDERLVSMALEDGSERWSRRTGTTRGPPVISGNRVFHAGGNTMYAFDAGSGAERWTHLASSPAPPAVLGNTVYVGGRHELVALSRDGDVLWRIDVDGTRETFATDSVVVVRTADGALRGHWQAR